MKKWIVVLGFSLTGLLAVAQELGPLRTLLAPVTILTTGQGLSAYVFDVDQNGISACYDQCEQAWPPIVVPAGAPVREPLSIHVRRDGRHQLAFRGRPLYTFFQDKIPGETNGDGLKGVWHLISLGKAAPTPERRR